MIRSILLRARNKDWVPLIGLFLLTRLIVGGVGILVMNGDEPVSAWVGERIYETHQITVPAWDRLAHLIIDGWFRWDTGWYLKIAALGYSADDGSIIFPPLYPLLIRWLAPLVGFERTFSRTGTAEPDILRVFGSKGTAINVLPCE